MARNMEEAMDISCVKSENNNFDSNQLPDLLPTYYSRLFPFALYYKWLSYNDEKLFTFREFSFTLRDDVYLRYQSFKDDAEMKKEIVQKCPYKIDIGAVYSIRPREQRMVSGFHPVEKELVFDIDMTDYDEVRTCCSGADICRKCWPLMTIALKILDRALREDFGYKHLLWVYSGRRGIHCWVCDERARKLAPAARSAVVEYLSVVKGGEYKTKKVFLPEILHPSVRKALNVVSKYFDQLMLRNQDILKTSENVEKISALCLDENAKPTIQSALLNCTTTSDRWEELKKLEDAMLNQKGRSKHFISEVMLQLCYPRLDVNVTKGLNHLLKAPFCVHPKTGRVCIPIDMNSIDSFDPFAVPTIDELCKEIDAYGISTEKIEDYSKTSLNKSILYFQDFVQKLYKENN